MGRRDVCSSAPTLLPEDERGLWEDEMFARQHQHYFQKMRGGERLRGGPGSATMHRITRRCRVGMAWAMEGSAARGPPDVRWHTPARSSDHERVIVRDRYSRTLRILLGVMMNWNRNCFR